jgi:hypothetical protein
VRTLLVDTSGGFIGAADQFIRSFMSPGDRLIMFDSDVYDQGHLLSQEAIDSISWIGGGGTFITGALDHCGRRCPDLPIVIFTDGFIHEDISSIKQVIKDHGLEITGVLNWTGKSDRYVETFKERILS